MARRTPRITEQQASDSPVGAKRDQPSRRQAGDGSGRDSDSGGGNGPGSKGAALSRLQAEHDARARHALSAARRPSQPRPARDADEHAARSPDSELAPSGASRMKGAPRDEPPGAATVSASARVAIIDRDSGFITVLASRLRRSHWEHRVVSRKVSAKAVAAMGVDALVVDVSLVGARRWRWLGDVCRLAPDLRIVVCTASSTVAERVYGLRLGVGDWLSKPCHPEELIARLEVVMREPYRHERDQRERLTVGEVELRPELYQAFVGARSLGLTRREYRLLELLTDAACGVQRRELLYERLWGRAMERNERAVDVVIYKLRRKLERGSPRWRYIHTDVGAGYRLDPQPAASVAPCAPHSSAAGAAGAAEDASETSLAA
jgi:DNA-binding response OmpR family regulator